MNDPAIPIMTRLLIEDKLAELERTHDIRIILAVESGSRAWRFASKDSDFDVRYIYVRNEPKDYVRVFPHRDVIEGPMDGVMDFSGWDLSKALGLLYKSNPCLFEWLSSEIVYKTAFIAGPVFRHLAKDYFRPIPAMHHYLSMVKHNYREHMRDGQAPSVRLKKYLYITRPLLCCRWIERDPTAGPPPMSMPDLIGKDLALPLTVFRDLASLIERKKNGDELDEGAAMPELNNWIDTELARLPGIAAILPRYVVDPERLNKFLADVVLS